jgi:alpha-L-rhamnosidase
MRSYTNSSDCLYVILVMRSYTGDAFATMHTSLMLFDGRTFYEKRLRDVADAQRSTGGITETAPYVGVHDRGLGNESGPIGWDTIFTMMQLALVRHHGNFKATSVGDKGLRTATEKWMDFLEDPQYNRTGVAPWGKSELGLGDWMPVNNTPTTISGRIFVALNYRAWGQLNGMGGGLGNPAIAANYAAKTAAEERAFADRFLDRATGLLVDRTNHSTPPLMMERMAHVRPNYAGINSDEEEQLLEMGVYDDHGYRDPADHGPTQCAQGMALGYGMVKPTSRATADDPDDATLVAKGLQHMSELSDDHMSAGMFGVEWVLKGLSRGAGVPVPVPGTTTNRSGSAGVEVDISGHDRAFAMSTATDYPSYGYMLGKNATTIWESWDYSNSTFSHNHPMFSGVVPWMVNVVAGVEIAEDAIGGDRLIFAPLPPSAAKLRWAKAAIHTPLGRAASSWSCDGKGAMELNVSVPVNTLGRVVLPSNKPGHDGWFMANVSSGNWSFSTTTVLCNAGASV